MSSRVATTAETTSASVDNLLLVAEEESDVAFLLADTAIDAVEGNERFEQPLALRALAKMYPNITQFVVNVDSGIETIEDLEGKTVSIGAPGSGSEEIGLRLIDVAGGGPRRRHRLSRELGVGESVPAMRDGSIDAFFWSGGVPTGAVTDLATTDDIRMIALDRYLGDMRDRYGEAYAEAEFEAEGYKGVAGPEDDRRAEPADGQRGHARRARARDHAGAVRRQGPARHRRAAGRDARPGEGPRGRGAGGAAPGRARYYEEQAR